MPPRKNPKAPKAKRTATKAKPPVALAMQPTNPESRKRNSPTGQTPTKKTKPTPHRASPPEAPLPAAPETPTIAPENLFDSLNAAAKISSVVTRLTGRTAPPAGPKHLSGDAPSIFESKSDLHVVVANLVNLMCRSCGAVVDIQPWQIEENIDVTLEEVFSRIDEDTTDAYVIGGSEAKHRHFRRNYPTLWKALMHGLTGPEITSLVDALTPWLFAMTESKSRAFRHSSSVAAFQIISGLLERLVKLEKSLEDSGPGKRSVQKEIDALHTAAFTVYAKSFVRRVRDVHVPIRALAIDALQSWARIYPREYLKPEYTKNFGFLLHDKSPEIRRKALDALPSLYATENESHDGLRKFTDRFRDHILALTRDVDPGCVAAAVAACKRLMQYDYHNDHLHSIQENYPKEAMDMVLRTVFDQKSTVRRAAGGLLDVTLKLNSTGGETEQQRANMRVEALLRFISEARDKRQIPGAAWYVVDALFHEAGDSSRDAKRKHSANRPSASVLFLHHQEIASVAVSDSVSLPLTTSAFQVLAALASKLHSNSKDVSLEALRADSLIELIRKALEMYQNIREIVPSITAILPHVDCPNISVNSSSLMPLLRLLNAEFERTSENAVLHDIAAFYEAILPLISSTNQGVRDVFQDLVEKTQREAMGASDAAAWKRAHALYRVTDLGKLGEMAMQQLQELIRATDVSTSDASSMEKFVAITGCVYRACFWSLSTHANNPSLGTDPDTVIADARDVLFDALRLGAPLSPSHAVGIFLAVCDLLSIHDVCFTPEKYESIAEIYCSLVEALVAPQAEANTHMQKELKKKQENKLEHASIEYAKTNAARRTVEVQVGQLTIGVTRLVKVGALSIDGVAEILRMWSRMPSKRLSDAVKDVFHIVKHEIHHNKEGKLLSTLDSNEDPFALDVRFELSIIHKSHAVLKENDQSPLQLQHFQNLCYRLAQTHFMPQTDESRRTVVAIIHALVQSISENPVGNAALVCAILPYTARIPSSKLHALTQEFMNAKLQEVPEFFRLLFVNSIRKKLPAEVKGTQESIQNCDDEVAASDQPGPTAETFLATPSAQQRQQSFSLHDLSLGQDSRFFDKDMLIGSMDTLLATAQSPPQSASLHSASQHLVDTVARPSGNAEKSSLIVEEDASEYFLDSQVLYE